MRAQDSTQAAHEPAHEPAQESSRTDELRKVHRRFIRRFENGGRGYGVASFLYVIGGGGLVKLGRSKDVDRRFGDLTRSSPTPLELLASIPESFVSEDDAHAQWDSLRAHGEWFKRTPELDAWIARLARRGRQIRAYYERRDGDAYPMPPRRRLLRLAKVDAQVEQRIAAREEAAARKKGCQFCGADKVRRCAAADGFFCPSCAAWLGRIQREGADTVGAKYRASVEEATARLDTHRERLAVLESGAVSLRPRTAERGVGA